MAKGAIKPDRFFSTIQEFVGKEEKGVQGITDEEKALATMARTSGWKVLKEYVREVVESLDTINEVAIENGSSFEEVGKNTVIISLAKGVIKKIIDKVEDAREATEEKKGTGGK